MVYHSIFQQMTFCQTSSPWPICLGWPHTAWLSFTELNRAVVHVIRLASCLWLWLQSVCPLMSSISAYNLTWVSLTLDVRYLFMAAPEKCSCCSLPWIWGISSKSPLLILGMGYLLSATAPDLGCGVIPLADAPDLGCGVAPLSHSCAEYVNREHSDVQAGFRKGRGTREKIANICWIFEKEKEFQKNIYFCFLTMPKPLTVWITIKCGKFWKKWEYQTTWPASS